MQDAELIVENLDGRGKAVGGAGGSGDDIVLGRIVHVVVHAHDDGSVGVLAGSGDDDLLGAAAHVQGKAFAGLQGAGGLDDDVDAVVGPLPFALAAAGDGDLTVVDLKAVFGGLHFAGEAAVNGIVLEQIGHFLVGGAMAVDDHHFTLGEEVHDAEQVSADTTKTVDANPDHGNSFMVIRPRASFGVFPTIGEAALRRSLIGTIALSRVVRTTELWHLRVNMDLSTSSAG